MYNVGVLDSHRKVSSESFRASLSVIIVEDEGSSCITGPTFLMLSHAKVNAETHYPLD